ncbi:hypothetical protein [Burkholderia mallei]|uniref:hypothetical protein n=1 Tax=Burkholderia mallei TaxID=13373 RepID=UPI00235EC07D|nr:hypothetical protein [Burkholderia mallei]
MPNLVNTVKGYANQERDVHAAREQYLQAAHADVVIREDDGARLHRAASRRSAASVTPGLPSRASSTVWIR